MVKKIAAIIFIFVCTCVAWGVLGGTIMARTYSVDDDLRGQVQSLWGSAQTQTPPGASFVNIVMRQERRIENNREVVQTVEDRILTNLPLHQSRINVELALEHRQKGLLWYSTYQVHFAGDFVFENTWIKEESLLFRLPLPTKDAIYDNVAMSVDGVPVQFKIEQNGIEGRAQVGAGKKASLHVSYRSQGLDRWIYKFGPEGVQEVRDFELNMKTNFGAIDFPQGTISPQEKRETTGGWELKWKYANLLSGAGLGMVMPQKLQPGPLAGQISFFAPVSLFFFFFLIFIITTLRDIEMHPMNYFFLAAAFFAFHLLLAYLVDHISIHAAFVICSGVSIFLVVSYLRLVVGLRFAAVEAGITQFVYLVLFSYAFFFKGFTGLAITIGSIITLFVVMQMTGRIRWAEKFAAVRAL